jgi:hypothetical protein
MSGGALSQGFTESISAKAMFEKRIPLKTQSEAMASLTCEAIEVHFDLVFRQLMAVDQIADAWRRLRLCYRTKKGRTRENQAKIFVNEIFEYLKELDKLMVERLDYVDPSAVGSDKYTDQMEIEIEAFESAMSSFAMRPVRAFKELCPCAFAAGHQMATHISNRLNYAAREFEISGIVEEINCHADSRDVDFEDISRDFHKWYEFELDSYYSLLKIERARAIKFLIVNNSKLKLKISIPEPPVAPTTLPKLLVNIPKGKAGATEFHNWVAEVISYLAGESLRRQAREYRIYEGRKRIDLVFTNSAKDGFFQRLDQRLRVFAPFVFVECKNMQEDPQNPDFDQLIGRFSDKRGHFGLLVCRLIKNRKTVIQRARDVHTANRGTVIVLSADDLCKAFENIEDTRSAFEQLLDLRYNELIM